MPGLKKKKNWIKNHICSFVVVKNDWSIKVSADGVLHYRTETEHKNWKFTVTKKGTTIYKVGVTTLGEKYWIG